MQHCATDRQPGAGTCHIELVPHEDPHPQHCFGVSSPRIGYRLSSCPRFSAQGVTIEVLVPPMAVHPQGGCAAAGSDFASALGEALALTCHVGQYSSSRVKPATWRNPLNSKVNETQVPGKRHPHEGSRAEPSAGHGSDRELIPKHQEEPHGAGTKQTPFHILTARHHGLEPAPKPVMPIGISLSLLPMNLPSQNAAWEL